MKLKVTVESKEREASGNRRSLLYIMLHVLGSMLFAISPLLLVSQSYCDTSTKLVSDESSVQNPASGGR